MEDNNKFKVVTSGQLLEGFDSDRVRQDFAALFKQDVTAVACYFSGADSVIKQDLDQHKALGYQRALQKIGLQVSLEAMTTAADDGLSLVPTEEEQAEQASLAQTAEPGEVVRVVAAGMMICPKCDHEQLAAEQCSGCGVYVEKVRNVQEQQLAAVTVEEDSESDEQDAVVMLEDSPAEHISPTVIAAATVAALVGAFIWKMIAVGFGYELGIVAWAIGGAVGFAATIAGGRGQLTGVSCGVLALLAIFAGKHLTVESWRADLADVMAAEEIWEEGEGELIFAEISEDARLYNELDKSDDASLRRFLVERAYSEVSDPAAVSPEEFESFYLYDEPQLIWMVENNPDYQQWQQYALQSLGDISSMEVIQSSFGFADLIFIFLGVATAYRLGFAGRVVAVRG